MMTLLPQSDTALNDESLRVCPGSGWLQHTEGEHHQTLRSRSMVAPVHFAATQIMAVLGTERQNPETSSRPLIMKGRDLLLQR